MHQHIPSCSGQEFSGDHTLSQLRTKKKQLIALNSTQVEALPPKDKVNIGMKSARE